MSTPFAIRIVGPSGLESYMDEQSRRANFDDRKQFATKEAARDELDIRWEYFRSLGFIADVVNVEDGE